MKRYPKYKDSGIEWLGEIPEGWEVKRLKFLLSKNDGGVWGDEPIGDEGNIVLRSTEVNMDGSWSVQEPAIRILSKSEKKKAFLAINDLLVTKSSGSNEHIGKTAYVDNKICELNAYFSNFMQRLRPVKKDFGKFFYYTLNNHIGREQMNFLGQTTTGLINLNGSILGEINIACPPKEDITNIAAFLDHKTARIDELIKKNEQLIELLKEKRQAVISQAVTKGLDPNAKMKDSGIEWMGEVPEGWEVRPLKYVASINSEALSENVASDYEMKYVDISNVNEEGLVNEPELMVFSDAPSRARRIIRKDDVIVSTVRTYLKAISYFPNPDSNLIVSTGFAVLRALNKIVSKFLYYFVRSDFFVESIMANSVGVSYPAINSSVLASVSILLPTINEQVLITDFLDRETRKINDGIKKIQSQIATLKEYRQALISNVVTGKVRVA